MKVSAYLAHFLLASPFESVRQCSTGEDKTFSKAVQHKEWRETMHTEFRSLVQNNTWKLIPLRNGKNAIGCKWVFKTKLHADRTLERYKARLVAKGFNQVEGINYTIVFLLSLKRSPCVYFQVMLQLVVGLYSNWISIMCFFMGEARYFLGLEITRISISLYVGQTKYIVDIVKDTGLEQVKATSPPFPSWLKHNCDCGALLQKPDSYRRLVSCMDSRGSLSSFCVFLRNALVSWKTKKQYTFSRSTAEAEYRSMTTTICEIGGVDENNEDAIELNENNGDGGDIEDCLDGDYDLRDYAEELRKSNPGFTISLNSGLDDFTGVSKFGIYAAYSRCVYSTDHHRKSLPTQSIAVAIDLKSLNYLRAHRRSCYHNTDRDKFFLGIYRPRYILRLHWIRLMMTIPQPPLAISKIQSSYARDYHDSSSSRTNPYYRNRESQSYRPRLKRLPHDDSRESVQSIGNLTN
ncbi:UNVERIFIED_CONTAM: putative mitochondrial protein [Sesamum calycinum]|uniref:Mitochondrial protein n=1 Tax=Sesamum calycinum TaxID=2727403 RepID=A0AAW2NUR7_9LAMI